MQLYLNAVMSGKTEEQQYSTFLYVIGERGSEIFNTFTWYKKIRDGVESTFSKVWRLLSTKEELDCWKKEIFHMKSRTWWNNRQGCSEGSSSVAFEVLSKVDFINLFIFNCLTSNINLLIFNCLTLNINLFNFNCLTSNFCFLNNIFFTSRRECMFMDARPWLRVSTQPGKWWPVIFETEIKFWGTLCRNILKCKFPTKSIELTRLEFFEGPLVPQLWSSWFRPFR